jgi:hypothetical protein
MADVKRLDIDITFGEQVVVTAYSSPRQLAGSTVTPERDLVREILMKALEAVSVVPPRSSITLNVDNQGTIQRDTTFNVPPPKPLSSRFGP